MPLHNITKFVIKLFVLGVSFLIFLVLWLVYGVNDAAAASPKQVYSLEQILAYGKGVCNAHHGGTVRVWKYPHEKIDGAVLCKDGKVYAISDLPNHEVMLIIGQKAVEEGVWVDIKGKDI